MVTSFPTSCHELSPGGKQSDGSLDRLGGAGDLIEPVRAGSLNDISFSSCEVLDLKDSASE